MNLDKKDIKYIANLARLGLTEEELETYGNQLSDVLSYINQLKEVDTAGVEPTAQVSGLVDVWREDEAKPWDEAERDKALGQAAELEDGQVRVERVL